MGNQISSCYDSFFQFESVHFFISKSYLYFLLLRSQADFTTQVALNTTFLLSDHSQPHERTLADKHALIWVTFSYYCALKTAIVRSRVPWLLLLLLLLLVLIGEGCLASMQPEMKTHTTQLKAEINFCVCDFVLVHCPVISCVFP